MAETRVLEELVGEGFVAVEAVVMMVVAAVAVVGMLGYGLANESW